jgi:hypothetical protein
MVITQTTGMMMGDDLEDNWQKVLSKTGELTDRLGMPVDEGIIETVVVLNLLGFTTTASCEGHLDRVTGGPYVIFESPEAVQLAKGARKINNKPGQVDPEYNRLRNEASRHSMQLLQKLIPYLEEFYKGRDTTYVDRVIIYHADLGCAHNILMCQGAKLAHAVDDKMSNKKALIANQSEMNAFTEFLKNAYFGN